MTPHDRTQLVIERMQGLSPISIDLKDESPGHIGHAGNLGGSYFHLTLVSAQFEGKSRIDRHRMILDLVSDLIPQEIHAFRITAQTPTEVQK